MKYSFCGGRLCCANAGAVQTKAAMEEATHMDRKQAPRLPFCVRNIIMVSVFPRLLGAGLVDPSTKSASVAAFRRTIFPIVIKDRAHALVVSNRCAAAGVGQVDVECLSLLL